MQTHPALNNWSHFDPTEYLRHYYSEVGPENRALLEFLVYGLRRVHHGARILEIGGGPTVYSLVAAAGRAAEIHFSDYVARNVEEVRAWINGDPTAFDWSPFVQMILQLEGVNASPSAIRERRAQVRRRVTMIVQGDASQSVIVGGENNAYDAIISNFCLDTAARTVDQFVHYLRNVMSLLKPAGYLFLSFLEGAHRYRVGNSMFYSVPLCEARLRELLVEAGCSSQGLTSSRVGAENSESGYTGLLFSVARKPC